MPQKRLFVTIKQSNKLLISFYPIMHFATVQKEEICTLALSLRLQEKYQYWAKKIKKVQALSSLYSDLIKHRQQQFNSRISRMESQFQCIKIKDALYLGSLASTQDFQFLQTNKFSYIVNCSAQIPNYFDNHGIKYLKFKLIKERSHKLWDENLKKLRKLEKFIEQAEQQSLCCVISSSVGNNRSLVMLSAYLMSRYRWTLCKVLEYIKSKKIFIGLTQHYINQLQMLENFLSKEQDKPKLNGTWKGPYLSEQQQIISKTYINSQEIPLVQLEKKQKKDKRVAWQDKIDKEKRKEGKEIKMKETGIQPFKKIKSSQKLIQEAINTNNSLSSKVLKNSSNQSPFTKGQRKIKKAPKHISVHKIQTVYQDKQSKENFVQFQEQAQIFKPQQVPKKIQEMKPFSEKELLKLIKKNLKMKKLENGNIQDNCQENKAFGEKGIYKLTINNFIAPNINIMNPLAEKSIDKNVKNNSKAIKREDKNMRTLSQKDPVIKNPNVSVKGKNEKNKSSKRNTQNSPKSREKKLQKAVSLQFKKAS